MATITEDYVSFEIARLLKEKGFNIETIKYWENEGGTTTIPSICEGSEPYSNSYHGTYEYSCPTLQIAMKWLREVHNLHIMVNCVGKVNYDPIVQRFDGKDFEVEGTEVGVTKKINGKWTNVRRGFKTCENACEAAIKYCLENLI